MPRPFLLAVMLVVTCAGHFGSKLVADEIVMGKHSPQDGLVGLELDDHGNADDSRLITAGELWEFFHERGVTSLDQLNLNLNCDGSEITNSGSIRFQIQDPNNGNILTNLSINPNSNRLEVPLEFDYMKRFSKGSKELIRLDLSELRALDDDTKVTVESDASGFGTFSVALVVGFLSFWVLVFFMLNRFTKPVPQDESEDIVILPMSTEVAEDELRTTNHDAGSLVRGNPSTSNPSSSLSQLQLTGQSKMVSAR